MNNLKEAYKNQEELWEKQEDGQAFGKNIPDIRVKSLHENYELRLVPEHGDGYFPVNIKTGEVCNCEMEWNEKGTVLLCKHCFIDGT